MQRRGLRPLAGLFWVGLMVCTTCSRAEPTPPETTAPTVTAQATQHDAIVGVVVDAEGTLADATVRVRATENWTLTAPDGTFTLSGLSSGGPVSITAWASGYYVGWVSAAPSTQPVTLTLTPYYTTDTPDYDWFSHEGAAGSLSCSHCMPAYDEWLADAHSQSAVNPRFLTVYNGTDVHGNQSPLTRYGYSRDYGLFALRPDPSQPYYGPGYRLDFPSTAGNCATCHVPAAAAYPGIAYAADPNRASGIELEGVFCEFCHKIGAVTLDPASGLPYPNMPGVLSMRLYRPDEGQQLFFGKFDDVTRRVSRLPLIEESAYCAPCHFGVFWDVVIYDAFGEWLRSPYSNPETGQTCQECHMPPVDYPYFVYPEMGGLLRDPARISSHTMPGAADERLLQNAVTLTANAQRQGDAVVVEVEVVNDRTGHHVPTDYPGRHVILLVQANDALGQPLVLRDGPTLPAWCGVGDPKDGYYAGLPGRAFAKVLEELWTGLSPTVAYWNPTRILSDNRLAAFESDTSRYTFVAHPAEPVVIKVTLLLRRAFVELMDQKGWDAPDVPMAQVQIVIDR